MKPLVKLETSRGSQNMVCTLDSPALFHPFISVPINAAVASCVESSLCPFLTCASAAATLTNVLGSDFTVA